MRFSEVQLSTDEINRCKVYARDVAPSCIYESEQRDLKKITFNHFIGKLGEFSAYHWLKNFGFKLEEPDLEIYAKGKKNHNSDLKVNNTEIAVKTQHDSRANLYGWSWTFQMGEYPDKIFENPFNLVMLVKIADSRFFVAEPLPLFNFSFKFPEEGHKLYGLKAFIEETEYMDCVDHLMLPHGKKS